MTISREMLFGAMIAVIALSIAAVTLIRSPRRFLSREEQLDQEVKRLNATVESLLRRAASDQTRITELEARISDLERELVYYKRDAKPQTQKQAKRQPVKKLLLIGGTDEDILRLDEHMLQGIGIPYTRLRNASPADIAAEFDRVRADDRLYPWVLISTHGGCDGTLQRGGMMTNDAWMRELDGVSVIGLATCDGAELADHLKQRGRFVFYFREQVPSDKASLFVKAFFQRLNGGDAPVDAFQLATAAVPEVAAYAEYRQ